MTINFQVTVDVSDQTKSWLEPLIMTIAENIAALTAVTTELKSGVTAIEAALTAQPNVTTEQAAALEGAVTSLQAVSGSIKSLLPAS